MNACMRRIRCLRRLQAYRPLRSHLADMAPVGGSQHTAPCVVRGVFERAKVVLTCDVLLVTPELDGPFVPTRPHVPDTWPVAELPHQLHVPCEPPSQRGMPLLQECRGTCGQGFVHSLQLQRTTIRFCLLNA
jgi:hypothetical protein